MKHLSIFILFIGSTLISTAQSYGIINDKDGFVNVRKSPSINSPIVGKIYSDQLFGYDYDTADNSKWVDIFQQHENTGHLEGYISRNKILPLTALKKNKKNNDSLSVVIKSSAFNPQMHTLQYNKPRKNERADLVKIDGKAIWGQDGGIPKKEISSVKIIKNGTQITIPKTAYNDLYEPDFGSLNIYSNKNTIYIEMENSDGAGWYTIIWVIKDNKFDYRYIGTI
ncbi:MAG: SH3 domain-containing protein [Mucilaginibacter sp.]